MRCALFALAALATACAHEEAGQAIIVNPTPVVLEAHALPGEATVLGGPAPGTAASRIEVLPGKRPPRPAEVVGVVDAHVPMGSHDSALAILKQKAAELGADAVIGVDLAHGEGHHDEPIHLSGLAIRYLNTAPGFGDEWRAR